MDRLDQMSLFARVVEAGSFAGAASALGQTRAAVSRQIAGLEQRLGAQLLHRTTRRMRLTDVGREYYKHCTRISQQVESADLEVASMLEEPLGWLRVAAPVTFGRRYLAPLVAPFTRRYPKVRVDISLSDSTPGLIADGFDLGFQVTASPDASLTSHALARSQMVVCGTPDYFARCGRPASPAELSTHNCLVYSELETPRLWRFHPNQTIRVDGNFAVNHGESLLAATLDGMGIAYMPTFIAGPYLANRQLDSILEPFTRSNQQIFALHPTNRNLVPKVQAFVDFVVSAFRPTPPWDVQLRRNAASPAPAPINSEPPIRPTQREV